MIALALYNYYVTQFEKVDAYSSRGMEIFTALDKKDAYGSISMLRGSNYRSTGDLDKAVKYLLIATEIVDPLGDFGLFFGYSHYQLAEIYVQIRDYEAAEISYQLSLEGAERIKRITPLFRSYNGLGNLYLAKDELDEAIFHLNRSLDAAGSPSQESRALCDLGRYYLKKGEYDKAIFNLEASLEIRIENGFEDASSTSLMYLSKAYFLNGHPDKALELVNKALQISEKFGSKTKAVFCYKLKAQIFEKKENWKDAIAYYHKFETLQDELNSMQTQNIYKLKNALINEQKAQIEQAHKEITDSIVYAKRIQKAILPSDRAMKQAMPEHFVLYKPKDVVAGDFYWLEVCPEAVRFAAADCTGHGVPGAMVSVICNNALNRAVREYNKDLPGEILDKTREIVIQEFEKSDEDVKDGMDIGLCSLKGKTLYFSGAHNPLWVIRNGELIEYRGDKQPVGKFIDQHPFTTHTVQLQDGDSFYLLTDGYIDQFGGPKGKKFKAKNLKDLILSIQDISMAEQHKVLSESFDLWRGSLEQVDDVCIIGVRM